MRRVSIFGATGSIGCSTIDLIARGHDSEPAPFLGGDIRSSTCESCGECVVHCPTGALKHHPNGNVTVDVTDEQSDKRAMEGILAFQAHQGPPMKVQFKEIYLKQLAGEGK